MQDYSQNKEQTIILKYFEGQLGYFLDIGGNDGETLSNTRALAQLGWRGVLVEPAEIAYKKLAERCACSTPEYLRPINAAIVGKDGPVDFWDCGTHIKKGDTSLLATTRPETIERWKETGVIFTKTTVPGLTFASLLKIVEWSTFNFISIDCEGADWEVLQQINLTEVGCQMLCVEVNGEDDEKFTDYAAKHGMNLHWSSLRRRPDYGPRDALGNRIYVK